MVTSAHERGLPVAMVEHNLGVTATFFASRRASRMCWARVGSGRAAASLAAAALVVWALALHMAGEFESGGRLICECELSHEMR